VGVTRHQRKPHGIIKRTRNFVREIESHDERLPRREDVRINRNGHSASAQMEQRCTKAVEVRYAVAHHKPSGKSARNSFLLHASAQRLPREVSHAALI
jgi:hypothetical protein